ncbi:FHA domain-containing protein [Nostoc spongiaeforme FACHB-130]|uniref:Ferredoxin--NADP reductase n=1 Tax=Nostoc spongiaeforme FACHB-130 TaxID=1357510 RepID=A0ABR8FRK8_9NOSO|nr:FAD-binding oxidoreductase [Nostoc spongiaeforme]MBD2594061.1 FHA domain-containing protein [Nostoc spongiaeforme FACHB-130]
MLKLRIIDPQKPNELKELDLNLDTMLNHECLIGRYPNCNVVLDSAEVSRMHGKISLKNGSYYYTDLASRAGSRLNADQIQINQDYPLKTGDMMQIGRFFLMVISLIASNEPTMIDLNINVNTNVVTASNGQAVQPEIAIAPVAPTPTPEPLPTPALPTKDPQEYMPLATVDHSQIERWMKGDLTVQCIQVIDETHDVKTFRFVADPPMLFTYKPGQFITLDLEINGEQVLRSYSISSTPSRPHTLEITVKRVPAPADAGPDVPRGLVSNWLHDNVKAGSVLKVNGPTGKFTCFANPSPKLLLISAGSGITPMMSMSRWVYDTASDVDIVFFHCARSPRDIIYRQELDWLAANHPKFNLAISITRREPGQSWMSFTGRLDAAMLKLIAPDYKERTVYVCGPNPFMESVNDLLESIDFPMQNYYEESFGPPRKKVKKAPAPAPAPVEVAAAPGGKGLREMLGKISTESAPVQDGGARVSTTPVAATAPVSPVPASSSQTLIVFSKSGKEVACDGEETILDMADQEGVKIRSSCRSGVCGTCKKRKLEGTVKMEGYDPEALEESEIKEGYVLTCVAYPVGKVVIDA